MRGGDSCRLPGNSELEWPDAGAEESWKGKDVTKCHAISAKCSSKDILKVCLVVWYSFRTFAAGNQ